MEKSIGATENGLFFDDWPRFSYMYLRLFGPPLVYLWFCYKGFSTSAKSVEGPASVVLS